METAWRAGDIASARELGTAASAPRLAMVAANLRQLRPLGLSVRPMPVEPRSSAGSADPQTSAVVVWRLAGDPDPVPTGLRLRIGAGSHCVLSIDTDGQSPPWLTEPIRVLRAPRVRLEVPATLDHPGRLLVECRRAVAAVRRVLPRWHATLAVQLPGDRESYASALGLAVGERGEDAAVTTTLGDPAVSDTVRVVLNPEVYAAADRLGRRVVLAHEATHVATGAAASPAPLWLVEGFADYVALRDVPVPVRRSASALLTRVRRTGPPARLPGDRRFAAGGPAAAAAYQGAWLAARLVARRFGEPALVSFYRRAVRDDALAGDAPVGPGCDVRCLTAAWRRELRRLAP